MDNVKPLYPDRFYSMTLEELREYVKDCRLELKLARELLQELAGTYGELVPNLETAIDEYFNKEKLV